MLLKITTFILELS